MPMAKIPADPNFLLSITVFGWITKKSTSREAVSATIFHISEGHGPSFVRERNGLVLNGKLNEFLKYQEAETISKALPLALLAAK